MQKTCIISFSNDFHQHDDNSLKKIHHLNLWTIYVQRTKSSCFFRITVFSWVESEGQNNSSQVTSHKSQRQKLEAFSTKYKGLTAMRWDEKMRFPYAKLNSNDSCVSLCFVESGVIQPSQPTCLSLLLCVYLWHTFNFQTFPLLLSFFREKRFTRKNNYFIL